MSSLNNNCSIWAIYYRKTRQFGQFPGTRDSRVKGVPGTGVPGSTPAGHIRTLYEPNFVLNQTMKSIGKFRKTGLQTIKHISDQYFVWLIIFCQTHRFFNTKSDWVMKDFKCTHGFLYKWMYPIKIDKERWW